MLGDPLGYAEIYGKMTDKSLDFHKKYKNRTGPGFNYSFNLQEGVGVGQYEVISHGRTGLAICKVNLCFRNVSEQDFDIAKLEELAKTKFFGLKD